MDETEIAAFFADLIPEQFVTDTSYLTISRGSKATFPAFLAEQFHMLRYAFGCSDGQLTPVAVVASERHIRYFAAQKGQVLDAMLSGVAEYSSVHRGRWLFAHAKVHPREDAPREEIVYWLAGARDDHGRVTYRQGYLEVVGSILGACVETSADQQPPNFRPILEYR